MMPWDLRFSEPSLFRRGVAGLWNVILLALGPLFFIMPAASAWEGPVSVPLDNKWELVAVTGATDGSSFSVEGKSEPRLEISYVFANVDWNSSENPDEKGRDRFKVAQKGEWDLSEFSWAELTVVGNGSHFSAALSLTDSSGRSAIY